MTGLSYSATEQMHNTHNFLF